MDVRPDRRRRRGGDRWRGGRRRRLGPKRGRGVNQVKRTRIGVVFTKTPYSRLRSKWPALEMDRLCVRSFFILTISRRWPKQPSDARFREPTCTHGCRCESGSYDPPQKASRPPFQPAAIAATYCAIPSRNSGLQNITKHPTPFSFRETFTAYVLPDTARSLPDFGLCC